MERLTKRIDGKAAYQECDGPCGTCDGAMCFDIEPMVDRLAAYEDTMTIERAKELAQAEKDGRLVVLPSEEYCWRIRGDLFLDIIRANCRAAHEESEAALKKMEEEDNEAVR